MPQESNSNSPIIDFNTSDDWTVRDLITALESLDGTYTRIALSEYLARNAEADFDRLLHSRPDPLLEEWFHYVRRFGRHAPPAFWPMQQLSGPEVIKEIEYYLAHTEEFLSDRDELVIEKIEMASPGGFSLRGLGEPIKQLREFIKDLVYRNRQERELGDLKIIEKRLALVTKYNLSPQQIQHIAVEINGSQQELRTLIEAGKLTLAGEEPNLLTENEGSATRRKRRKPPPSKG